MSATPNFKSETLKTETVRDGQMMMMTRRDEDQDPEEAGIRLLVERSEGKRRKDLSQKERGKGKTRHVRWDGVFCDEATDGWEEKGKDRARGQRLC